jgi:hypothetical protein
MRRGRRMRGAAAIDLLSSGPITLSFFNLKSPTAYQTSHRAASVSDARRAALIRNRHLAG